MGSSSQRQIQISNSLLLNNKPTNFQSPSKMLWDNLLSLQQQERTIQPYNPNSLEYQFNVEVEGVIFDILAPPTLLDDLEPFENQEQDSII